MPKFSSSIGRRILDLKQTLESSWNLSLLFVVLFVVYLFKYYDQALMQQKLFVFFISYRLFLMLHHTSLYLRKTYIPLNSFHDLNKFIDTPSNEPGSGDSIFGGRLKYIYYGTYSSKYHKPKNHWTLNSRLGWNFISLAHKPLMLIVAIGICYNTFHWFPEVS